MPGLLIYLLAATLGSADPASSAPAAAPAKPAKDEMVCTYQTEKDSHFKKRVCMTRTQRDALSALERQDLQNRQRTFCSGANC
jgi:hypothetical protein